VRPQPTQRPVRWSTWQIRTQGLDAVLMGSI
jgi:hypothetical protein